MNPNGILKRGVGSPAPGSLTAWLAGCTCPREANHHGAGAGLIPGTPIPIYYFDAQCPLHHDFEQQLEEAVGREWIDRWYAVVEKMNLTETEPVHTPLTPAQRAGRWQKAWHWLRRHVLRQEASAGN